MGGVAEHAVLSNAPFSRGLITGDVAHGRLRSDAQVCPGRDLPREPVEGRLRIRFPHRLAEGGDHVVVPVSGPVIVDSPRSPDLLIKYLLGETCGAARMAESQAHEDGQCARRGTTRSASNRLALFRGHLHIDASRLKVIHAAGERTFNARQGRVRTVSEVKAGRCRSGTSRGLARASPKQTLDAPRILAQPRRRRRQTGINVFRSLSPLTAPRFTPDLWRRSFPIGHGTFPGSSVGALHVSRPRSVSVACAS